MSTVLQYQSFAELPLPKDLARRQGLFQVHPTQVAAKEIVSFAPPQTLDAALAEADRKLAAGESLLPKSVGPTVLRRA